MSSRARLEVLKKDIARKLSVRWFHAATKRKTDHTGGRCRKQGLCVLQREVNNNLAVTILLMLRLVKQMFVLVSVCYNCIKIMIFWSITPPKLPSALYLCLSLAEDHRLCIFQSELIHTAWLWIAKSSRYLACEICDSLRSRLWSLCDCHSRERASI